MFVPFDQTAISYINRIEEFVKNPPISMYGRVNAGPLLSILWWEAAHPPSDGVDDDFDHIIAEYPFMKLAWEATLSFPTQLEELHKQVETAVHEAVEILAELETRIDNSVRVVNALSALEGSAMNIYNEKDVREEIVRGIFLPELNRALMLAISKLGGYSMLLTAKHSGETFYSALNTIAESKAQ